MNIDISLFCFNYAYLYLPENTLPSNCAISKLGLSIWEHKPHCLSVKHLLQIDLQGSQQIGKYW